MIKKILIIGKSSFIGNNLFLLLKKKFKINQINFDDFHEIKKKNLNNYQYIINCSSNNNYVKKKYNEKYDFDLFISKKIKNLKCKFIFLSTRKVYPVGDNINENNITNPNCNYSINKLLTEKKLTNILAKKVLILRISNLVGMDQFKKKKRKIHMTFIDHFFLNASKGILISNKNIYKDFLSIKQFAIVIEKLIKKNANGIYNVSIGKKVYLDKLNKYLNFYNRKKLKIKKPKLSYNKDCFYLNNDKLYNKINIKFELRDLQMHCKNISKLYFQNEK